MKTLCHLIRLLLLAKAIVPADALASRSSNKQKKSKSSSTGGGGGFGAAAASSKAKKDVPAYIPDNSESAQNLVTALMEEECEGTGREGGTEVGFHGRTGMRGLFTAEDFQPGEFLLGIPFPCCLALSNDNIVVEEASDAELGRRLLEHLNNNNRNNNNNEKVGQSFLRAYFQSLPTRKQHFDATPDFWKDDDIDLLEFPPLVEKMKLRKQQIQELAKTEQLDLEELQFATWLVKSRGFTLLKPTEKAIISKTVLMPYLDMVNHATENPNAELQALETKVEDDSFYALQALRPISKGKEITISYGTGKDTSVELLSNYGFVPAVNQNDAAMMKEQQYQDIVWNTSLKDDEQQLSELLDGDNAVLKTILQFRIRMKRAAISKN